MEHTDILIVGGGPGGLACATQLARHGARVVLVERKPVFGPKVCAGGITWHGLLRHVPHELIERQFPEQVVVTPRQQVVVAEQNPIIATVSRERLGQWMAAQAAAAGVTLLSGTRLAALEPGQAILERGNSRMGVRYGQLVGADGSCSQVRRYLNLPSFALGIGLNAMVPGHFSRMEWHLDPRLFGSGYGWIFPHATTCSIGAYADSRLFSARTLKEQLFVWAGRQGIALDPGAIRAGLVNFDYRGVCFEHGWLVGDAAGLASGLTGEGIYPALVSGRVVARMILDPAYPGTELATLARKQRRHGRVMRLAGRSPRLCGLLMDLLVLLLRMKIIDFHSLEMAD